MFKTRYMSRHFGTFIFYFWRLKLPRSKLCNIAKKYVQIIRHTGRPWWKVTDSRNFSYKQSLTTRRRPSAWVVKGIRILLRPPQEHLCVNLETARTGTKEYRSKEEESQREARRYYSSTNGNAWKVYRHPATCSARDEPMEAATPRKDQPGARFQEKVRTTQRHAPPPTDRELFKWNSQNEPAAFASAPIQIGGTTEEPYAVHKAFLCRPPARPRLLFARQFDTDLRLRPSQIAGKPRNISAE